MISAKYYTAALHMFPGMSHTRLRHLLELCKGDVEYAWKDGVIVHGEEVGLKIGPTALQKHKDEYPVERIHRFMEEKGIDIVVEGDGNYHQVFAEVSPRPYVYYVQGNMELLQGIKPTVAFIGSRRMSSYAKQVVKSLVAGLMPYGVVTVSGLAYGVDHACHTYTLEEHGKTVAVLGTGIDKCYPTKHQSLKQSIGEHGLVLSDFPLGTQAKSYHFPMRNRLVAALSQLIVVVEASERSGALITAKLALDMGKDVAAIPGNIFSTNAQGVHQLLKTGAACVTGVQDILDLLHITGNATGRGKVIEGPLAKYLGLQPVEQEDLLVSSGLPLAELQQELTMLELQGYIERVEGTKWVIA